MRTLISVFGILAICAIYLSICYGAFTAVQDGWVLHTAPISATFTVIGFMLITFLVIWLIYIIIKGMLKTDRRKGFYNNN
jgi:uncharacterized membrane protein